MADAFALIRNGVVWELFDGDPGWPETIDVRNVAEVSGIQVGWIANEDGSFGAFVRDEPAAPMPDSISRRQFAQGLWKQDVITFDEAKAFVKTGDLPAAMTVLVAALPQAQRSDAELLISGSGEFQRSHPLTQALATGFGWTEEVLDEFWQYSSQL